MPRHEAHQGGSTGRAARRARHQNLHDGAILRLLVIADGTQVKIEVSPVLRGVVHEPSTIPVTEAVEEAFGFAETSVESFGDLFAGKLVAALDGSIRATFSMCKACLPMKG